MAESDVVRIAREYREQLERNEDQAIKRMSRYWVRMERQLQDSFTLLVQEIADLQSKGQAVPVQYVYNMRRYQDMLAQIQKEMPGYQMTVEEIITETQKQNYILGLENAQAVLRASDPSDDTWNQVGKDAAETMAGFAGNGAPLAQLLQHDYGDMTASVTDALVTGVGLGKSVQTVAQEMRDAMGMEYSRSVRIARTEINRSYRLANAEQYRKSGVVEKVLRLCYPPTACLACLVMDGDECPNGVYEDHPNGKCSTIAVNIGGHYPEWEHGVDWLKNQTEPDQRRIMGDARYEMWQQGVPLREMVTMRVNPVWGGSPSMVSIADLKAKYNIVPTKTISIAPPAPPVPAPAPSRSYSFDEMMGDAYKGNKYTEDQKKAIRSMYEAAPQEMQDFYHKYSGDLQPILENNHGKVPRTKIDFGYFSPRENRVHFLPKRDAAGRSDQKPFELGVHEYLHNLDYIAGGKNFRSYLSNQYRDNQGRRFFDIITADWENSVRVITRKAAGEQISSSDISYFCTVMRETYTMSERGVLSDMFENFSVSHGGRSYPFGIGHGASYSRDRNNVELETFAEIGEAIVANHDSLEVIQEYLPNVYNAFLDMIVKAAK